MTDIIEGIAIIDGYCQACGKREDLCGCNWIEIKEEKKMQENTNKEIDTITNKIIEQTKLTTNVINSLIHLAVTQGYQAGLEHAIKKIDEKLGK